jgi:hypothetical protein
LPKVLRDCGRWEESERLFREAIEIWMETGDHAHTSVGFLRHEFSKLLLAMGRAGEAQGEAEEALAIHERAFEPMHQWTKECAGTLAAVEEAVGHIEKARQLRARHGL